MKIAHVADPHWGFGYAGPTPGARFTDITRTMEWVASRIINEQCDLVLFAGDAFKDARVFIDRATEEIQAFVAWLRRLSDAGIEVIVISGTPSHDAISAYHLIREMQIPGVEVVTEPQIAALPSDSEVIVACLPGMNRSSFATDPRYAGLPPHEFHAKMTDDITAECAAMREEVEGTPLPVILMSHLSYDLADLGFEDALLQNEPILTDEAARMFDLVALGHIHRPQRAGSNVFYSGAPDRHNFGDEHTTPGFWIHETGVDEHLEFSGFRSTFIETNARRFRTIDWCDMDVAAWMDGQVDDFAHVRDAIVRVRYVCSEELQKRFDRRTLERALYDSGAFFVAEIRAEVERTERIRDAEVTEGLTPLAALAAWANNEGIAETECAELLAITEELMGVLS